MLIVLTIEWAFYTFKEKLSSFDGSLAIPKFATLLSLKILLEVDSLSLYARIGF